MLRNSWDPDPDSDFWPDPNSMIMEPKHTLDARLNLFPHLVFVLVLLLLVLVLAGGLAVQHLGEPLILVHPFHLGLLPHRNSFQHGIGKSGWNESGQILVIIMYLDQTNPPSRIKKAPLIAFINYFA